MKQDLQQSMALLTRTPAVLNALLRGLPEAWTRGNEGEKTWSAFDVVVHLIHCEREDWILRAKTILEFGETREFAPFDRWGEIRESQNRPLEQLLDEFAQLRAKNLGEVHAWDLKQEDFERRGRHPGLGVVTLSELMATWAVHDLNHLHQISRVMAYQYREALGPWSRYLGVMQCNAHGA